MPKIKVLIDYRQCFKPDGSLNVHLFHTLGNYHLLEHTTLVIDDFAMDGRLNDLFNRTRRRFPIISIQDLFLIENDSQFRLKDAFQAQKPADERYSELEKDIKEYGQPDILQKIILWNCIERLLDKNLIDGNITLANLRQHFHDPSFAMGLIKKLLPNFDDYDLHDHFHDKFKNSLQGFDPIVSFDCQTLVNLGVILGNVAEQQQTIAAYRDQLYQDYVRFSQHLEEKAEYTIDQETYDPRTTKHLLYIKLYNAVSNLFFLSHCRANKRYQLSDINTHYLAQLTTEDNKSVVIYIGKSEDLPKPSEKLPEVHCTQVNHAEETFANIRAFVMPPAFDRHFFDDHLQKINDIISHSPALLQLKVATFIEAIKNYQQELPHLTPALRELMVLLHTTLCLGSIPMIQLCQAFVKQAGNVFDELPTLRQGFLDIVLEKQLMELILLGNYFYKNEIHNIISNIEMIRSRAPEQIDQLLTITCKIRNVLPNPTKEDIAEFQKLATQLAGLSPASEPTSNPASSPTVTISTTESINHPIAHQKDIKILAQDETSLLWQGLGIALMALGAALIVTGALIATGTLGLGLLPSAALITTGFTATQIGIGTIAGGSAILLSGGYFSFFGCKNRGLASHLQDLHSKLPAATTVDSHSNLLTSTNVNHLRKP